ncbi:MAG: ACT domain-containing protein [Candidatus Aenigmarchaeota archaeon]|nr:ACT domain-containing protein [Candidatus Aenigmarchaeota archaeon]
MQSPNIVKVDSKGRILIPVRFREGMGVTQGTEMIIAPDDQNNHLRVLPISKDCTAEIRMLLSNMPGSLASVADALSANSFNILLSESRSMGEDLAEWRIIVDVPDRNNGVDTLTDVISGINGVKSLDVIKK